MMIRSILLSSVVACALSVMLLPVYTAHAADAPRVFITWHANSYVPQTYAGKALPTTNSNIAARVNVISNGKSLDLSGQTIYWYVNGEYADGGIGKTTMNFTPTVVAPNNINLRVSLPDFSDELLESITIPLVRPQVALEIPVVGQDLMGGIKAIAHPYFFNTTLSLLQFNWTTNNLGQKNAEFPDRFTFTPDSSYSQGSTIAIGVSISNPSVYGEIAQRTMQFLLK